jgi:histidine triad (HIT) family protein
MQTFEDVVAGRRSVHTIWEDERHLAFLAPCPARPGHALVIPRRVAPYVFDLDDEAHAALWRAARAVARLLRERLPCERVCAAVVGWEVRHVHVHLLPTNAPGEFPPLGGAPMDEHELEWIAQRVRTGAGPTC